MWPFRRRPMSAGQRGEELARKFLKRRGLKILARNYRCPAGEIDIIALDTSTRAELGTMTLAFVEVKARSSARYVEPQSAVNAEKRRRIERVAQDYLATHDAAEFNVRFDVVAVVLAEGRQERITYLQDAF